PHATPGAIMRQGAEASLTTERVELGLGIWPFRFSSSKKVHSYHSGSESQGGKNDKSSVCDCGSSSVHVHLWNDYSRTDCTTSRGGHGEYGQNYSFVLLSPAVLPISMARSLICSSALLLLALTLLLILFTSSQ